MSERVLSWCVGGGRVTRAATGVLTEQQKLIIKASDKLTEIQA